MKSQLFISRYLQICFALSIALLLNSCAEKDAQDEGAAQDLRLAPVKVVEVEKKSGYPVIDSFVAVVEARRRSQLAFEIPGTLEKAKVDEGVSVEAGAILATLDTSRLRARLAELEASRAEATATLQLARTTLTRDQNLRRSNAVSQQKVDQSLQQRDAAIANLSGVEAQIESVRVDLSKSELRAPYPARIARRYLDEGAVVAAGTPAFDILETGALEVRAALSSDAMRELVAGDQVSVILPNSPQPIALEVLRVLPQRDAATRTIDVILKVPETLATKLRDGDLVSVESSREVLSEGFFLPRDALTESIRGLWACYIALPDPDAAPGAYALARRDLEVLQAYEDRVFVRGPIESGDWVLASGLQKIAPGQRVQIAEVERSRTDSETLQVVE
ncbi:MAG: efflux RND transporter periplasmic adaptor subunit [Verrucomicrobiota bacterium]